jgi:hypothetical protein
MKEGNGRARALWYGDWWGSPHLFPSPRMAQTRHPLHRCALRPSLSNGHHLEAPQVRWRGEVGHSTLGPLRMIHDRRDMMVAVLMKHCASHRSELPAFSLVTAHEHEVLLIDRHAWAF